MKNLELCRQNQSLKKFAQRNKKKCFYVILFALNSLSHSFTVACLDNHNSILISSPGLIFPFFNLCEEGWVPKNWCFWTVVLQKALESPLDCKEIQPVHSEGHQPWDFFGRNDAKAETPVLWLLMQRVDSLEKTLMLGGTRGRRRRGRQRIRWPDGITY